ncbi:response regulator transcription factor [Anaeroselena agilis]|uniref:Response regulator transcription factor n=1 Tax=Anaeroselena agilis TaxID=3063788 RepID=A0ABU3NSI6_9FIRM|nr:response regulator transcription factor [Selenomonadales bacterium 4137-cl]
MVLLDKSFVKEAFAIMGGYTALVVDDDENINGLLTEYLAGYGFRTLAAYDGEEALRAFACGKPDIIVLDIMLPKLDGIEVCRQIRRTSDVPILMLTARGDESDKLVGLELGADDYITKPFSPREIAVRLKAILRRCGGKAAGAGGKDRLVYGSLVVDREACSVRADDEVVNLTATEFKIFEALAEQPGRVFNRMQIATKAQGTYFEGCERTIDAHIKNIRQKLSAALPGQRFIETVRSMGYKFERRAR